MSRRSASPTRSASPSPRRRSPSPKLSRRSPSPKLSRRSASPKRRTAKRRTAKRSPASPRWLTKYMMAGLGGDMPEAEALLHTGPISTAELARYTERQIKKHFPNAVFNRAERVGLGAMMINRVDIEGIGKRIYVIEYKPDFFAVEHGVSPIMFVVVKKKGNRWTARGPREEDKSNVDRQEVIERIDQLVARSAKQGKKTLRRSASPKRRSR